MRLSLRKEFQTFSTMMAAYLMVLFAVSSCILYIEGATEVDLGDGLTYVTTFMPDDCTHRAEINDVIHYHYVGRLGETGKVFGRSFDYNTPYIVALGQGRIIAGMDKGLVGTCLWERRKITFPPELGYGERGVGQIIPPNSTLVFYIRMVKIERNGRALGSKPTIKEAWIKGLEDYTNENWESAIESIEEALDLFNEYQKQTKMCLNKCKDTVIPELKKNQQELVDKLFSEDPLMKQYLNFAARAKCIKQCKKENLPSQLRDPDPLALEKFNNRDPYSYLQYSYYKLGNYEEGIKCAYPYFFYNPNDTMITNSINFYRKRATLSDDEFPAREPGMKLHHQKYEESKKAYGEERWLEAADLLEEAIDGYVTAINECRLMCEDVVYINFTDSSISESKLSILKNGAFLPDSMEYYQLLSAILKKFLKCRTNCETWMATINGKYHEKYLPGHFHHMQYVYYKLGMLHKSAEAASTFRVLEPSDVVMANNIKYYRSNLNVPFDSFEARNDIADLRRQCETEQRILSFIETGLPKKRIGSRGDNGDLFTRDEL